MDDAEIREIYERYAPIVYRRALQILRSEDDAMDIVQDVFERILQGRHGAIEGRALLLWMYRVATNRCLNRLRDRRRRATLLVLHRDAAPSGHVGLTAARVDAARTVAQVAEGGPERELAAAVLCHIDGMTQEEAAEVLGVTSRTIRNLLRRFERRAAKMERMDKASESGSS